MRYAGRVNPQSKPAGGARARWYLRLPSLVLMAVVLALAAKYGQRLIGLPNFSVVEEGRIYRSGQPSLYQLEKLIRTRSLRTVVNLREPEAPAGLMRAEQALCDGAGVRMVRIPMSDDGLGTYDQYDAAVALLADPTNLPALVHCERGIHRTGGTVAAYRVLVQGWTEEDALSELVDQRGRSVAAHLQDYLRSRRRRPAEGPAAR